MLSIFCVKVDFRQGIQLPWKWRADREATFGLSWQPWTQNTFLKGMWPLTHQESVTLRDTHASHLTLNCSARRGLCKLYLTCLLRFGTDVLALYA